MDYDEFLHDLFHNKLLGIVSLDHLYQAAKLLKPSITRNIVREWYRQQQPAQRIVVPRKTHYHPIISDGLGWQVDVMNFQNLKRYNTGFSYLMTFINSSTRFVHAFPMKTRKKWDFMRVAQLFLNEVGPNVTSITTDSEFFRLKEARDVLNRMNIKLYLEASGQHSKLGIINRFHRTIRDLLKRYFIEFKTRRWIDIIGPIIDIYNDHKNRTTGKSPREMTQDDILELNAELQIKGEPALQNFRQFQIGDRVRHINDVATFHKGSRTYSERIYNIIATDGFTFILRHDDGKYPPRQYLARELKIV